MTDTREIGFLRGLLGLVVLFMLLGIISRTRTGYVIVYNSLVLVITLILLTQSRLIAGYLGDIGKVWST